MSGGRAVGLALLAVAALVLWRGQRAPARPTSTAAPAPWEVSRVLEDAREITRRAAVLGTDGRAPWTAN